MRLKLLSYFLIAVFAVISTTVNAEVKRIAFTKDTLAPFESIGVYTGFNEDVEVQVKAVEQNTGDDNNLAVGVAAAASAVLGFGVLDAAIMGGIIGAVSPSGNNSSEGIRGEDGHLAFPPEGPFIYSGSLEYGSVLADNDVFIASTKKVNQLIQNSEWITPTYIVERGTDFGMGGVRDDFIKRLKNKVLLPDAIVTVIHSVRFSEDYSQIWYIVDACAYDVPLVSLIGGKLVSKDGDRTKYLGSIRFAAMHDMRNTYAEKLLDNDGKKYLEVINGLASEVNVMMQHFYTNQPVVSIDSEDTGVVLKRYWIDNSKLVSKEKTSMLNKIKKMKRKRDEPNYESEKNRISMQAKIERLENEIKEIDRLENESINNLNELEQVEHRAKDLYKYASAFNIIGENETRYRLYNGERNDFVSLPKRITKVLVESVGFGNKRLFDTEEDSYGNGKSRLVYSILYANVDRLPFVCDVILRGNKLSHDNLEAVATRLWSLRNSGRYKTIDSLVKILVTGNGSRYRDMIENIRHKASDKIVLEVLDGWIKKIPKGDVAQYQPQTIPGAEDKDFMRAEDIDALLATIREGGDLEKLSVANMFRRSKERNYVVIDIVAQQFWDNHYLSDNNVVNTMRYYANLLGEHARYREMFKSLAIRYDLVGKNKRKKSDFKINSKIEEKIQDLYKSISKEDVEQFVPI